MCTSLFHVTAGINSCSLNPKIHFKFYILARTVNISFDSGKVENGDGLEKYFPFRISQDMRKNSIFNAVELLEYIVPLQ